MSLLKEKEKAPAVTVRADMAKALLAKQNVQKPSPIRKAWGGAKKVGLWTWRNSGLLLFSAGVPLIPWMGPLFSAGFGFGSVVINANVADKSLHGSAKKKCSAVFTVASTVICLFSAIATLDTLFSGTPRRYEAGVSQAAYDTIRAQFAAGQEELTASRSIEVRERSVFSWVGKARQEEVPLTAKASEAQLIDGQSLCWDDSATVSKTLFATQAGTCPVLVHRFKDGTIRVENKVNGAKGDGIVVEKGGQSYALPMAVP